MSEGVLDSLKALISRRAPTLDFLRIGWFGGEPLIGYDRILSLASHVQDLMKTHPTLTFDSGMSTNGSLLTRDRLDALVGVGVNHFQVTFDGPARFHDTVRVKRNNGPTFDTIWNNLSAIRESPADYMITLRVHISGDNADLLGEFVDTIKSRFGNDERFRLFFKTVVPLGGANDDRLNCLDEDEAKRLKDSLERSAGSSMDVLLPSGSDYICYAARPTSFVVRCDGTITKCTVGLDDPDNCIGHINADGTLSIDQDKVRPWIKGAVALDPGRMRCPRASLGA